MAAFLKVGKAIAEVWKRRIYRTQYPNWDDYLTGKLGMAHQYARRLIQDHRYHWAAWVFTPSRARAC